MEIHLGEWCYTKLDAVSDYSMQGQWLGSQTSVDQALSIHLPSIICPQSRVKCQSNVCDVGAWALEGILKVLHMAWNSSCHTVVFSNWFYMRALITCTDNIYLITIRPSLFPIDLCSPAPCSFPPPLPLECRAMQANCDWNVSGTGRHKIVTTLYLQTGNLTKFSQLFQDLIEHCYIYLD